MMHHYLFAMTQSRIKNALAALAMAVVGLGTAQAANLPVSGSLDSHSPTFNRPTDRSGFPASANSGMPYVVVPFSTGSLGGTVIATVGNTTAFDSFLALYTSFDPANPQANLLAADDDGAGYPHAQVIKAGLSANTNYVLVLSSYSANADAVFPLYGSYALTISGDVNNSYAVTATASPLAGGTVSCTPNPVTSGSSSTCTASANPGYTFSAFSGDCTGASCVLSNVTTTKSVTASFTQNTYAITATANPVAGGTVTCSPNPVTYGGGSTCTASANPGYTFAAFSGDCTGASCVLSNVTAAQNVTASFTQNTYAITATASPLAGGTVTCTPNPVTYGGASTCTASANPGYTFGAFSADCTGASCVLSNVTSAKTVTASFTQNTYTVTTAASPVAGGTVSCTPNPVAYGSSSTCTASANPGYTFGAFSGDCTGASCVLSNVTSAKSVTASFTQNSYTITATASPLAGGSVTCTPNPVTHGSSSTCTASANPGYNFGAFSGDCSGGSCVLSNVTSAKTVTASFVVNAAPVASAVALTGTPQVGLQLTGSYTYFDAESDTQATSTFRWMTDTQTSGATKTAIAGANASTYAAVAGDAGNYLFFCVTPVASTGTTTGVEVCSAASTQVAGAPVAPPVAPPLIPPLGVAVSGLGDGPTLLNMAGGSGPTIIANVVTALQSSGVAGLQYVGQSPTGAVILSTPSGQNIVFAPTAVQANDGRANGLYPLGNGQYQIVANGVALTVVPMVQNLDQLLALLPAGASATMTSTGVLVAKLGGLTYVVQPSIYVQLLGSTGAGASLVTGADGFLHFTDASGNSQTLYPAFKEPDALLRILQSLDAAATLSIQLDGTASMTFNGRSYTLVPDLTLGGVPTEQVSNYWWQEGPTRFRVRIQGNWVDMLSQGFTLRN